VDWNDFLTERDKAVLATTSWAKRAPFGLGDRPAVLVVDLYYAALGLPRAEITEAVREWPSACGEPGWRAVDRTVGLLAAARAAGVPVIYFHATPPSWGRWNRKPASGIAPGNRTVDGNQIVAEVAPQPDDVVIAKIGPSGFHGSPLDTVLRMHDRDTVIVCGEATSGCVRSTVVDACSLGYRAGVVEDCCFDRFEAAHWMSLFDLNQKYADVITADAVENHLGGLAGRGAA
jgi:maleamate amidohydrolase